MRLVILKGLSKLSQKAKQEKPVIFGGKDYYITREDTRNLGLYVFGEEKILFKGYFSTIEAALSSLVTNSLLLDETQIMDLKTYKESILEMKEQIISDIKQYFREQTSNSINDLEEDELFN
ncbi:TPA: hypothetical protein IUX93_001810 [Enterococcus faecalis]|uniref:hypothetical protein n=1 Tax=Enterococcus faecalis TaxID=1351 RepID=UPI00296C7B4C|nr:hypothetical protein [Enterococcus faecalis]HAP4914525.1 hypothetical protein [Enterococcus faecalis]HAP4920492.1 hypothetical protein [Enterococcus faecalis]